MCGTRNLKFQHDKEKPHIHMSLKNDLEEQNFVVTDHPPYSSDLAPCDFWLFSYIKASLSNHTDSEILSAQITEIVSSISESEYRKTFNKWLERIAFWQYLLIIQQNLE